MATASGSSASKSRSRGTSSPAPAMKTVARRRLRRPRRTRVEGQRRRRSEQHLRRRPTASPWPLLRSLRGVPPVVGHRGQLSLRSSTVTQPPGQQGDAGGHRQQHAHAFERLLATTAQIQAQVDVLRRGRSRRPTRTRWPEPIARSGEATQSRSARPATSRRRRRPTPATKSPRPGTTRCRQAARRPNHDAVDRSGQLARPGRRTTRAPVAPPRTIEATASSVATLASDRIASAAG